MSRGARRRNVELYAPEVGCRCKEFNANSLAAVARFSQKNNAALQLFLSCRILQDQHLAVLYLVFEQQQTAVCVDDHSFTGFAELLAIVVFSRRLYGHPAEDASAPARGCESRFGHTSI